MLTPPQLYHDSTQQYRPRDGPHFLLLTPIRTFVSCSILKTCSSTLSLAYPLSSHSHLHLYLSIPCPGYTPLPSFLDSDSLHPPSAPPCPRRAEFRLPYFRLRVFRTIFPTPDFFVAGSSSNRAASRQTYSRTLRPQSQSPVTCPRTHSHSHSLLHFRVLHQPFRIRPSLAIFGCMFACRLLAISAMTDRSTSTTTTTIVPAPSTPATYLDTYRLSLCV